MNSPNHPDSEQLNAYVRDPMAGDYRQLRLHLASCMDCRKQVNLLTDLKNHLPGIEADLYEQNVAQNAELQDALQTQLIEKFVDDQLREPEQQRVAGFIRNNPQAMKAAMHYASHSARMPKQPGNDKGSMASVQVTHQTTHNQSIKSRLLSSFHHWLVMRSPVWLTVPVTAAVAGILTVSFIPQQVPDTRQALIVAYQDNPVIQFQRTQGQPGIGFFANANKTGQPYSGVETRLADDDNIHLSWPKVTNAISYTMHLRIFENGQTVSVGSVTTRSTQAVFQRAQDDTGKRYVWRLNGRTDNGKSFTTGGGFVINSKNE